MLLQPETNTAARMAKGDFCRRESQLRGNIGLLTFSGASRDGDRPCLPRVAANWDQHSRRRDRRTVQSELPAE
jgi:hypothetical protein